MKQAVLRRFSVVLSAALAGWTPALVQAQAQAQSAPASHMEIAGLRLGMTEAEARAALQAFDPALKITPVMGVFNYSDGVNPILKTPEFLDRLEGSKGNEGVSVKVYFSGPIGDVRVIVVYRTATMRSPPTGAQFVQSLTAKYGQPSGNHRANEKHLVWESAGKPSCIRIRGGNNKAVIDAVNGVNLMTQSAVERSFTLRRDNIMGRGLIPADLTQCGAYLHYVYMGEPVSTFTAEMSDIGAMVLTERSRSAWVDRLKTEAIRKREGQAQSPRL